MSQNDSDQILETLEGAGVKKEDQFDALTSVLKLAPPTTTERDILAGRINAAIEEWDAAEPGKYAAHVAGHVADAILAVGYRKPRTITNVEQLETVYAGALLVDAVGEQWGVYGGEDRLFLVADGWEETYDDDYIPLPATVVYEPS